MGVGWFWEHVSDVLLRGVFLKGANLTFHPEYIRVRYCREVVARYWVQVAGGVGSSPPILNMEPHAPHWPAAPQSIFDHLFCRRILEHTPLQLDRGSFWNLHILMLQVPERSLGIIQFLEIVLVFHLQQPWHSHSQWVRLREKHYLKIVWLGMGRWFRALRNVTRADKKLFCKTKKEDMPPPLVFPSPQNKIQSSLLLVAMVVNHKLWLIWKFPLSSNFELIYKNLHLELPFPRLCPMFPNHLMHMSI